MLSVKVDSVTVGVISVINAAHITHFISILTSPAQAPSPVPPGADTIKGRNFNKGTSHFHTGAEAIGYPKLMLTS